MDCYSLYYPGYYWFCEALVDYLGLRKGNVHLRISPHFAAEVTEKLVLLFCRKGLVRSPSANEAVPSWGSLPNHDD